MEDVRLNYEQLIDFALKEDIGDGDHSSLASIPTETYVEAKLVSKAEGIICGVEIGEKIFKKVDNSLQIETFIKDGKSILYGDVIMRVKGNAISILTAERTVLNFMQRLSGIATHTNSLVKLIEDLPTKILDTRKTTPGMRYFEKYAVKIGGAENHRFGLFDMVMLKDNHIDFAGGIKQAIERTHEYLKKTGKNLKIEIEVRSFEELDEVLSYGGIDRIMLDNFSVEDLALAVKRINKQYETEASGGITKDTLRKYAETGVDFISVGALTHQIKSLDLSLIAYR